MNVTLFGYPKTGKTTLFNLLAGAHAAVRAYDDGKREPNVRTVPLPDPRLDRIAAAYPEKKKTAAALDLTDLVGISFGEVKTSLCLGHLRKADGLVHVARGFAGEDILPPGDGSTRSRTSGAWRRSSSWPTSSSPIPGWSAWRRTSRR